MHQHGRELFSFGLIADTHVSEAEALTIDANFMALSRDRTAHAVARMNAAGPDFVVHLGDITHPNPGSFAYEESIDSVHDVLGGLRCPLHFVPGNHDIGEKLMPGLAPEQTDSLMTEESISLYERHFSAQYDAVERQGCLFVFLNGQLHNSGLDAERAQAAWLEELLAAGRGKRIFMFSHYPLFLASPTERDHYDAVDEPARSWLLGLLRRHGVEAYFAGHVHNFFYNLDGATHHYVLPSVCFLRHDYHEMFRVAPGEHKGRHDLAKLGFGVVTVHEEGHVCRIVRTWGRRPGDAAAEPEAGHDAPAAPAPATGQATVGVDMGTGWCETTVVPTPWGLDAFHRKRVRNDYPLLALWEMGIRPLRFLAVELLEATLAERMEALASSGHRMTAACFGMPDAVVEQALVAQARHLDALEVIAPVTELAATMRALAELKARLGVRLIVNAFRPGIDAWNTCHGFTFDDGSVVRALMAQGQAGATVDGVVFGVDWSMTPAAAVAAARDITAGLGVRPVLHVQFSRRVRKPGEDLAHATLGRTAEAAALALAAGDVDIVLDNFSDIDRGYFFRHGLVDRLFNLQPAGRTVRALHALLGGGWESWSDVPWPHGRLLRLAGPAGAALLLLPDGETSIDSLPAPLAEKAEAGLADWIDLADGTTQPVAWRHAAGGRQLELDRSRSLRDPVLLRAAG